MALSDFEPWLTHWHLEADGAPFASPWNQLLPVRREGHAMVLKAHMAEQEVAGSVFLATYGGRGAVHVYEREADAVLMERATGPRDLINIALEAGELAAFQVLCDQLVVLRMVTGPFDPAPISMDLWFSALPLTVERLGGIYPRAADLVSRLLATTDRIAPLHGDPAYDYAIMLCLNPAAPTEAPAKAVDVARRAPVVAAMAGLSAPRLLAWTTCLCALYSAWFEGHEGG